MSLPARRFRREALSLALLLALCQGAFLFLHSQSGLRFFATGDPIELLPTESSPTLGDVQSLVPGESLTIRAAGGDPAIATIGPLELEGGRTYLVIVRAGPGLAFSVLSQGQGARRPDLKRRVPSRGDPETFILRLDAPPDPEPRRVEIWNTSPAALEVSELALRGLHPAYDWARRGVRPTALLLVLLFAVRHRHALTRHFRAESGASSERAEIARSADALIAYVFFLVTLTAFVSAPAQQRFDSRYTTVVSHRLLTAGTLSLPADFAAAQRDPMPYQLRWLDGTLFHSYPNAPAILNAPIVALFSALDLSPVAASGAFVDHHEHRILAFAAALQAALLCALLYLLARIFVPPGWSLGLAAVFAFGTQVLTTVSRSYWSHTWAVLLLTGALYLLLQPRWRHRGGAYAAAASLLSWSFFCRPTMSASILALTGFVLVCRRDRFAAFAAAGAAWAVLFAVYLRLTFGALTHPYLLLTSDYLYSDEKRQLSHTYPKALVDSLLSPGNGLLVLVPFFGLLLVLVACYWRRLPHRSVAATALAAIAVHWQLICTNRLWNVGGFGPRLMTDALPWFYVLALLVALVWRAVPARRAIGRRLVQTAAVLLVFASVLVHTRSAATRGWLQWDGYSFWNWRGPHFLGRVPPPPRERTYADRLAELTGERDAAARGRLLDALVRAESLPRRQIQGATLTAFAVTWDHWTYGANPGLLLAENVSLEELSLRLELATWAPAGTYPIAVTIEDGESVARHLLAHPGTVEVPLAPVPARSRRLYVVRSDKAWTPEGPDGRDLGVQLRAVAGKSGSP